MDSSLTPMGQRLDEFDKRLTELEYHLEALEKRLDSPKMEATEIKGPEFTAEQIAKMLYELEKIKARF